MKQISKLFIFLLMSFIVVSCSNGITGNPKEDADNMVKELTKAGKEKDYKKINEIVGFYYEYYSNADLVDRVAFLKSVDFDNLPEEDIIIWHEVVQNEDFQNAPNVMRLSLLEKDTKKEAREKGIW